MGHKGIASPQSQTMSKLPIHQDGFSFPVPPSPMPLLPLPADNPAQQVPDILIVVPGIHLTDPQ